MDGSVYYVNGDFVAKNEAALSLSDLGIVRGYGVFDLLRTYDRLPFRLRQHIHRLENSARLIGIALPWSTEELEEIVLRTHELNSAGNASIRIVVTGGQSDNLMTPHRNPSLVVMIDPVALYSPELFANGCIATSTTIERIMPDVKSLNYIGAIMAMADASPLGAIEAIYKDSDGNLTEGTRSNLFVIRSGKLITPKEDVLMGITRQAVLDIAAEQIEVVQAPISYSELDTFDEAFLTSTTKEILPLVQIDDTVIGSGQPGTQTRRLMMMFREHVQAIAEGEIAA